jgi:ppGpp synthetase/RelA/SpoT-type nucleotidyltranferase
MDEEERAKGSDLLRAAGPLLDRANSTLRHSELFDGTYAISSRVKSGKRLHDKITQRRAEGRDYSLDKVTDIIGIRLINLYRQDVPSTVDALLGLVFSDLAVDPNSFRGSELLELISYTSNSIADSDPVNVEIKRIFEDKYAGRTKVEFVQKERERYSSVHIVIKRTSRFEGDSYRIPIEIQVRSAFEDVWGEIDHKLLLEMGRYGEPIDEGQRKIVAQHMGVLKKMMDSAADYADVIRRTVVQSPEPPAAIQRSLDGADYVSQLCTRLEIPAPLREQLIDILREKATLDKDLTDGHTTASEVRYIDLAQSLAEISPALESIVRDSAPTDCRHLVYLAKMEEALCRLLSSQQDQLQLSLSIYENITKRFPEYPTGWFRMGQALQRRSDISEDIEGEASASARAAHNAFAEARRRLREMQRQPDETRLLFISPGQESYIRDNAARLQAFVVWRLSDRRRRRTQPTERDLADVLSAFHVAEDGLHSGETEDPEGRLSNGAAFYVADATVIAAKLGRPLPPLPTNEGLRELISRVEAHLPPNPDHRILHWDTVVRVQELLGNDEAAKSAATKIMDLISDEETRLPARRAESTYVAEAKARAVQHAWKLVRPSAG